MSRIFISYRRDDSAGHVGWLRSLLIQRFGADQIFRDIETIPPGVDFVEAIETAVGSCDVLLAVIGPRWLTATGRRGERRLDDPEDFVRIEIATALERSIRVIPVLVQDAHMPRSNELPAHIAKLARRNSIELRDSSWEFDVGRLGDALESILQSQAPANQVVQPPIEQPQPVPKTDTLIRLLLLAEEQRDWDTAVTIVEHLLKIDPSHETSRSKAVRAYNNRGLVRKNRGDLNGAISDYSQAIKIDPNYAPAYYNRGRAQYEQANVPKIFTFNQKIADQVKKTRAAARNDFEHAAQLGHEGAKQELSKL